MTRRLLMLVALLWPVWVHAAEPVPVPPGQMLQGRFIQERVLAGIAKPLRSEGRFLLVPGTGLIWRAEKPFATITVITPGGLVQQVNDQQTLNLPSSRLPALKPFYDMLSGALAGDWNAIAQTFTVTRMDKPPAWGVRLAPKKADAANMPFEAIELSGRDFVEAVEIAKTGGDRERLVFLDQALAPAKLAPEDAQLFALVGK